MTYSWRLRLQWCSNADPLLEGRTRERSNVFGERYPNIIIESTGAKGTTLAIIILRNRYSWRGHVLGQVVLCEAEGDLKKRGDFSHFVK